MMSEEQFIKSQKECASMLGMPLSEYENYCKDMKVPSNVIKDNELEEKQYDNSILKFLGLTPKDLKTKKGY